MAEKYGVIPPKFTKAWWGYFWEYYKWHVIGGLFVIICVVTTAVQCATREKYDITVTYAGNLPFDTETQDKIEEALSPFVDDIDKDGKQSVFFQSLTISGAKGQEQYDMAIMTKLDLEFQNDCSNIFLHSPDQLDRMLSRDYVGDSYVPVDEWGVDVGDREIKTGSDGVGYAVNVSDSKLFKDLGLTLNDTYIVLKGNYKDDDKNKAGYESALKIIAEILK